MALSTTTDLRGLPPPKDISAAIALLSSFSVGDAAFDKVSDRITLTCCISELEGEDAKLAVVTAKGAELPVAEMGEMVAALDTVVEGLDAREEFFGSLEEPACKGLPRGEIDAVKFAGMATSGLIAVARVGICAPATTFPAMGRGMVDTGPAP